MKPRRNLKHFQPRHRPVRLTGVGGRNKPSILRTVAELTERVAECSSAEVAATLFKNPSRHDVHSVGRMLALYKSEGLITNRKLYRLSLWRLTDEGKEYLKEQVRRQL